MIALQPPRHHTRSSGDSFQRSRPAFEKLFIGPVMVFGEMITGGHYLEVLRVGKQLAVGREAAPSYVALHRNLVHESGFFGAFYRGFLPWGLFQCCKGVPVLFVQHESMHHLQATAGWSSNSAEKASGFLGGFAQALFVNPLQKIKVSVVACQNMNAMHPTQAFKTLIKQNGVLSLYDGFAPMALRRSLDWGIRFAVTSEVKNWVIALKVREGQSSELNFWELICCGMIGGALSTATHPIDNIITNSMKPMPVGVPRDFVSVTRRMYRESGIKGFTRAWGINMLDNAYHMAWMYGVGTVAYEWMGKALQSPRH